MQSSAFALKPEQPANPKPTAITMIALNDFRITKNAPQKLSVNTSIAQTVELCTKTFVFGHSPAGAGITCDYWLQCVK